MTPIEALEQAAVEFERDRESLLNLAVQEMRQRKCIRGPAAERASVVYENELRTKAAVIGDCARKLRERAKSLRGEAAA